MIKTKYTNSNIILTKEGGIAIRLINNTGAASIKGYIVEADDTINHAFEYCAGGDVDPMGIVYQAGIPDGQYCLVVVSGMADVYYSGSVTRGTFGRVSTSGESLAAGIAVNEALPTSPFATDKHFMEIGHPLEARTGAGLARTVLHFN